MFETDPVTMATLAHNAVDVLAQAGPPAELPAQVPEFVGNVLGELGQAAGETADGLGETISGLTPGGEVSDGLERAAGSAEHAGGAVDKGVDAAEQAVDGHPLD